MVVVQALGIHDGESFTVEEFVTTVIFGLLENTVHTTSPGQHGDQQGNGPLRYSCEFLLHLQN